MADDRPALPPLRDVIARHGLAASKALGQNFLLDEQLLDRIAAIPGPLTDASAFEVGPGPGGLTRAILRAGGRLVAVERDDRCLPALAELSDAFPGQLKVIAGDAMQIDAQADDLAALIRALGLDDVTVLGHSMGARIAIRMARRHFGRDGQLWGWICTRQGGSTRLPDQPDGRG